MIKKKGQYIRLDTAATTLVIRADTAEYLYYGQRLGGGDIAAIPSAGKKLFSCPGTNDYTEYSLLFESADGGFAADLQFSKARVLAEKPEIPGLPSSYGDGKTLELKYVDAASRLSLFLYYTAFDNSDVIAVSSRLVNGTRKPVRLRRLMSLQLDLTGDYSVVTFDGGWAHERQRHERDAGCGIFVNDSKSGYSSHAHNPFIEVKNEYGVYGFNLVYSGNHKETVERGTDGRTRVLVGINDYMFDWALPVGETFSSPEAVMCWAPDEDALSLRMHAFVGEHIVRGKWKRRERPVLVNNWEGTYFDFNEEKLLSIAAAAKEAGAELFVLDDGWFGHRNDDTSSLGDWYDNVEKTGGGLASLADKVRAMGLSFGIWVEPEMISEDSDLYRAHPNYAMKLPGRKPVRLRNQLMLNMADERVQNFVVRTICDVIARSNADYVKWDFNRSMTDCYGKGIPSGEYFHRYMLGYYRVVCKITKRFPFVLFEGCAGGGGRLDLGSLCFFSQYWTSDNTDARERIAIQSGTSYGYPQTVMGAHVSACPNHQTGASNSLEARFNVACEGLLGYELDLTKLSEEERAEIASQISFYKENRKLLQFGDHYRLQGKNTAGFITVSKDRNAAIAVVNLLEWHPGDPVPCIRLKGLNPAANYEVSVREGDWVRCIGGDVLMQADIPLPGLFDFEAAKRWSGGIMSRMYILRRQRS